MTGRLRRPTTPLTIAELDERVKDLERRSGSRPTALRPSGGDGSRAVELVVAAHDSTDKVKASADYVCAGAGDEVTIQAAVDELYNATASGQVVLAGGHFVGAGPVTVRAGIGIRGAGLATGTQFTTTAGACFVLDGSSPGISGLYLMPAGATAIDGTNGGFGDFYGIFSQKKIILPAFSFIHHSHFAALTVSGPFSFATACMIEGLLTLDALSQKCTVSNCTIETIGQSCVLNGEHNVVQGCSFFTRASASGVGASVSVTGLRNNFVDNFVHGTNGAYPHAYAVQIEAAASAARVKHNDLRPGVAGAWGTGVVNDLGTASVVGDNDS